ncbi:MAG: sigma-70 family RNA polymerase sigma factor [Peptoniphilus sp.]|nr:sigma-70 family RNA polymerase sigma factor [Peptoniphilus sp.]MDY6045088.1 sigma-70 family RNA polymerase sigma factor [Peptoniphilus sp.]
MEGTLIARAKARDGEATATLVAELERLIAATIRRTRPFAVDRDNLIGEAYYILLQSVDDYDEDRGVPFHLYFQKRLRYFLLNDLRHETVFESYPIDDHLYLASDEDVASEVEENEACRELKEKVARLSERERAVVVLFYREELSLSEIAGFLGCSYQTVANTKVRALKKLRRFYADR